MRFRTTKPSPSAMSCRTVRPVARRISGSVMVTIAMAIAANPAAMR